MASRYEKTGHVKPFQIKKPSKLSDKHLEFIKILMENPNNHFLSLNDIKDLVIREFNLEDDFLSIYTIQKALRYLKITYKKVTRFTEKRNSESTLKQRKVAAQTILSCIKRDIEIVFLDEVGFNQI